MCIRDRHRIELRDNKGISNPRKVVTIQPGSKTTYNVICPDEG